MLDAAEVRLDARKSLAADWIAPERRAETLSIAEFDRLAGLVEGSLAGCE